MNDYISRQAAIEAITQYAKFLWERFREPCNLAGMIEAIGNTPSADVMPTDFHDKCMKIEIDKRMNMVEVVRCKDCRKWITIFDREKASYGLCEGQPKGLATRNKNDYCSYGERKDGGEEK